MGISLLMKNFPDHGKNFVCGNLPRSMKNLCLRKTFLIVEKFSLIIEKSLLVESVLDQENVFACGKRPWFWKNLCLRKFSLIMEKSLLVETFFFCGKVFPWGKHLDQEKYLLVENFLNRGKVFWKWSYLIKQVLILKPLRYVFLNLKQKFNLLTILLMENK